MENIDNPPDPRTVELASASQRWAGVMPDIRSEVERAKTQVEMRVFSQINAGTLTPEAGQLAWLELHALDKMLKRFNGKVRFGQALNLGETDNG